MVAWSPLKTVLLSVITTGPEYVVTLSSCLSVCLSNRVFRQSDGCIPRVGPPLEDPCPLCLQVHGVEQTGPGSKKVTTGEVWAVRAGGHSQATGDSGLPSSCISTSQQLFTHTPPTEEQCSPVLERETGLCQASSLSHSYIYPCPGKSLSLTLSGKRSTEPPTQTLRKTQSDQP